MNAYIEANPKHQPLHEILLSLGWHDQFGAGPNTTLCDYHNASVPDQEITLWSDGQHWFRRAAGELVDTFATPLELLILLGAAHA